MAETRLRRKAGARLHWRPCVQWARARWSASSTGRESVSADEVMYGAIMEDLGYSTNRRPFRQLVGSVPFSRLALLRDEPDSTRLATIGALLFGAARLAPPASFPGASSIGAPKRVRYLWKTSGVRPPDHPTRRLAGAAMVFERFLGTGPAAGLAAEFERGRGRRITEVLTVRPYIGTGRAREAAVNSVLPSLPALAAVRRDRSMAEKCLSEFRAYPGLGDNALTREMQRLLALRDRGIDVRGARRQQGLVHLYKSLVAPGRTG